MTFFFWFSNISRLHAIILPSIIQSEFQYFTLIDSSLGVDYSNATPLATSTEHIEDTSWEYTATERGVLMLAVGFKSSTALARLNIGNVRVFTGRISGSSSSSYGSMSKTIPMSTGDTITVQQLDDCYIILEESYFIPYKKVN